MTAYDVLALFLVLMFGTLIISVILMFRDNKKKPHLSNVRSVPNPTVECSKCGKTLPMSVSRAEDVYVYNQNRGDTVLKYIRFDCNDC